MPKAREFGENRICQHEGCRKRLSKYNPNNECFCHAPYKFSEPANGTSDLLFNGVVSVDPKGGTRMPSDRGKAREYPNFRSVGM